MHSRRQFLAGAAALVAGDLAAGRLRAAAESRPASSSADPGDDSRAAWVRRLVRVARPVLEHLARGTLKASMPVECAPGTAAASRSPVTHLEAVGRTLSGIAPWLARSAGSAGPEGELATALADAARRGLANAVDPASPDRLDFAAGAQNLVDAAFLCLGLLRGPSVLWAPLGDETKRRLVDAVRLTRKFKPGENNWLLFASVVEAWLRSVGQPWQRDRVEPALARHAEWYKGDGAYGDGPAFHWDYYNSFVIQPMLLETVERLAPEDPKWAAMRDAVTARAVRYAAVQERLIAPDGTFPPLGRSLAYRCGAFHHLAAMALRQQLPDGVAPAQVRGALAAVIRRTLDAPGTFDEQGWLTIGLAGHQPSLAEGYISTGSLYLCTTAFLPLGLPPDAPFWSAPAADWTQRRAWGGQDVRADHAIKG